MKKKTMKNNLKRFFKIGVDVTNDKVEDDTEMVDFQTLIHLPQWKEYEKFDVTYDEEKQKVFFILKIEKNNRSI